MNNDALVACLIDSAKSFLAYSKYYRGVGDLAQSAICFAMATESRKRAAILMGRANASK
ncbi:hypothetical protein [Shewanella baltica]|uniref:hypothetical protein n=1 Tax=Shewanella baltica TaxID=62322 RepID=UPI003D7B8D8C